MPIKSVQRNRIEVTRYDGSNEKMNAIMDGETVWRVQGPAGLKPIIADTPEEALEDYLTRFYSEPEEEDFK